MSTRKEKDDELSLRAAQGHKLEHCQPAAAERTWLDVSARDKAQHQQLLIGTNNLPSNASILLDVDQRLDSLEKEGRRKNIRLVAEHRELLAGQIRIVITSYTNDD